MILLHTYQKNKTCQQHTTYAMRHDYATFGNQRSACVDNGSLCLRHLKKKGLESVRRKLMLSIKKTTRTYL